MHFSTLQHISTATYSRLLISNLLPESVHRVLYIDSDILVLHDLEPLMSLDLEGAILGAVLDERLDFHSKTFEEAIPGLPHVRNYFNAAVMLVDIDRWRTRRVSERALEYLGRFPHTPYSDQDALNFACDGEWKKVDHWWNRYQVDLEKPLAHLAPSECPAIIHFHGKYKPWDARMLNVNAGFYDTYRSRTKFARTPAEKVSDCPFLLWSRVKQFLKRSKTLRNVWKRLHSQRMPENPNTVRRTVA